MRGSTFVAFAGRTALGVLFSVLPAASLAASPVNTTLFGNKAIQGYDPVAYVTDGGPVEGRAEFKLEWMGATWLFASAAHRDAFKAQPEKYAPQYGGYCAFAVAKGKLVDIDPEAWTIVDGKLYLNYDLDVQKKWTADMAGFIAKADKNWPALAK